MTQWDAGVLTDSLVLHSVFPELTILPMRYNYNDSFIDVTAAQQDYGGDERTEPPFYHRLLVGLTWVMMSFFISLELMGDCSTGMDHLLLRQ